MAQLLETKGTYSLTEIQSGLGHDLDLLLSEITGRSLLMMNQVNSSNSIKLHLKSILKCVEKCKRINPFLNIAS